MVAGEVRTMATLDLLTVTSGRQACRTPPHAATPDESLDAVDLLKAQHRRVEDLFGEIEKAHGKRKGDLFDELADALAIHAAVEEEIFYPAVKMAETEQVLREAVE